LVNGAAALTPCKIARANRDATISRMQVLVVDDDPDIRALLTEFLAADLGVAVATARDGQDALAQVALARPDAVLLDLMMPVLDGFEVCHRLKADPATRDIPVVAVSAGRNADGARACGCDDFVAKPFDIEAIEAALHRWLPAT
jgi:two-component system cell cycle response regulator DivK